jgi:hypothetical protein
MVVDQLVLFDDLLKQTFVGRTNESVSGRSISEKNCRVKGMNARLRTSMKNGD